MSHIKFWHVLLLMILVPYLLGSKGCPPPKKTDTPGPPTGCGVGDGQYEARILNGPPWEHYCDLLCCFEIEFEPKIHNTISGFNRFHFQLKKGSSVYRSNYVQFDSGNWDCETVEWGGCLEDGEYKVTTIMENIQLNSTCEDSVYKEHVQYDYATVDIEQLSWPDKTMQIEYFCQDSDTSCIDRYDVFLSPNTGEYMDVAFNVANTGYDVTTYDTNLAPQLIEMKMRTIKDYIFDLKYWEDEMLLCGIKGFTDTLGYYRPEYTGITFFFSTPIPACSTGSLVAVKACMDLVASEYKIDYNDFVTATTVHELGHQRASIMHEDYHSSQCCIMKLLLIEQIGSITINRYCNPHFCDNCISRTRNIDW